MKIRFTAIMLCALILLTGCGDVLDELNAEQELSGSYQQDGTTGSNLSDAESEVPQVFGDVAIAREVWGNNHSVLINKESYDEDFRAAYSVKSDDQGIIRYLYIRCDGGVLQNVALDRAKQYTDTEYLGAHYTYSFSYRVHYKKSDRDDYFIVYDPLEDESIYGQFVVLMYGDDSSIDSVNIFNTCMYTHYDVGLTPDNIRTLFYANDEYYELIEWDEKL